MTMGYIRLVPTEPIDPDRMNTLTSALQFTEQEAEPPSSDDEPDELIWLSADGRTALHLVKDALIDVTYLAVRGEQAEEAADRIRALLDIDEPATLRDRIVNGRDLDGLLDTIYRTAVAASAGYDADAFALLSWALFDPEPLTRRVALVATSITGWQEFVPLLDYICDSDFESEIRSQAARVRDLVRKEARTGEN